MTRRRLSTRRAISTRKLRIGGQALYLGIGEDEDGTLAEVFLDISRAGTGVRDLHRTVAILLSIALQHGVPLDVLLHAIEGTDYQPSGAVSGSEHVREATSIVDLVIRELRAEYQGGGE